MLAPGQSRAQTVAVGTEAELVAVIKAANASQGDDTIQLTNDIVLTGPLPMIDGGMFKTTIDLNGLSISGNGQHRIFVAIGGNIEIKNGKLADGVAKGGDGGDSAVAGGGGGMGAGGALLVGETSSVTLTDVQFVNNRAVGGDSGAGDAVGANGGPAGGGGLGGDGSPQNPQAGRLGGSGGGGAAAGSDGGQGQDPAGGNGGGPQGGAGADGQGSLAVDGGPLSGGGGGPAGGIGDGGDGGWGGGGGGGGQQGGDGGDGGFGGGGGGSFGDQGGNGGFGGGGGGATGAADQGRGGFGGADGTGTKGGGGAGFGGAVFVRTGGILTIGGRTSFALGSVTAGSDGALARGEGIFLQSADVKVDVGTGQDMEIADTIADDTGNGNASGSLTKQGQGQLRLTGKNTYTGETALTGGSLLIHDNGSIASESLRIVNGVLLLQHAETAVDEGALTATPNVTVDQKGTFLVEHDETVGDIAILDGALGIAGGKLRAAKVALHGTVLGRDGTLNAAEDVDQFSGSMVEQGATIETAKTYGMHDGVIDGNVKAATFLKTGGTMGAHALVVAQIDVRADGGTIAHAATDGIEVSNQLDGGIEVKTAVPIANLAAAGVGIKATSDKGSVTVDVAGNVTGRGSAIDITTQEGDIVLAGEGDMTGASQSDAVVNAWVAGAALTGANIAIDLRGNIVSQGSSDGIAADNGSFGGHVTVNYAAGTVQIRGDDAIAIKAEAVGDGNVSVTSGGNLSSAGTGFAKGIYGKAEWGRVEINSASTIDLEATSASTGIWAHSNDGKARVISSGTIDGGQIGIRATSTNDAFDVSVNAAIGGKNSITFFGVAAEGQSGTIAVNSSITADGAGVAADSNGKGELRITQASGATIEGGVAGIFAQSHHFDSNIVIEIDGTATGYNYGLAAVSSAGGGIRIAGSGALEAAGDVLGSAALTAQISNTMAGNIVIDRTGVVTHTATGDASVYGIFAHVEEGNDNGISIVNRGTITVGEVNATGVAAAIDGTNNAGDVTVDVGYVVNAPSGKGTGVFAATKGSGNVSVTTGAVDGGGVGVSAGSLGVGNVSVTTRGAIGGRSAPEQGINTETHGGDTTIALGGKVTSDGDAVEALATGTGNVLITGQGDVVGGSDAGDDGIDVEVAGGNALIDVDGKIVGDPGVVATSAAGGSLTLAGNGDVTGTGEEAVRLTTSNGNGNVKLARNGNLTGATGGASLSTGAANGAGTGTVDAMVFAGTTLSGASGAGLKTLAELGKTTVGAAGGIVGTSFGIDAHSAGGALDVALQNGAFVTARSGTGINLVGSAAPATVKLAAGSRVGGATALSAATTSLLVDNAGSLGQPGTTTALKLVSGTAAVHNLAGGQVFGGLNSAAGSGGIAIDNQAGSAWQLADGAALDLKGQNDSLDNAGLFAAGAGTGSLAGLERLANLPGGVFAVNPAGGAPADFTLNGTLMENGGGIDLANTAAGQPIVADTLTLAAGYQGAPGSTLSLDVDLGSDPAKADRLIVIGNATGTTEILFKVVGSGWVQATPVVVVDLDAAATNTIGLHRQGLAQRRPGPTTAWPGSARIGAGLPRSTRESPGGPASTPCWSSRPPACSLSGRRAPSTPA